MCRYILKDHLYLCTSIFSIKAKQKHPISVPFSLSWYKKEKKNTNKKQRWRQPNPQRSQLSSSRHKDQQQRDNKAHARNWEVIVPLLGPPPLPPPSTHSATESHWQTETKRAPAEGLHLGCGGYGYCEYESLHGGSFNVLNWFKWRVSEGDNFHMSGCLEYLWATV